MKNIIRRASKVLSIRGITQRLRNFSENYNVPSFDTASDSEHRIYSPQNITNNGIRCFLLSTCIRRRAQFGYIMMDDQETWPSKSGMGESVDLLAATQTTGRSRNTLHHNTPYQHLPPLPTPPTGAHTFCPPSSGNHRHGCSPLGSWGVQSWPKTRVGVCRCVCVAGTAWLRAHAWWRCWRESG